MGDAVNDNFVDVLDFSLLGASYDISTGQPGFISEADFNGDGIIDVLDFSLLGANYDTPGEKPSGF